MGRTVTAEQSRPKESILNERGRLAVYIENLAYSVRQEKLKEVFEKEFGPVQSINLPVDEHNRSKGFAFVEFQAETSQKKAIDKRDLTINGRVATIKQSTRKVTSQNQSKKRQRNEVEVCPKSAQLAN